MTEPQLLCLRNVFVTMATYINEAFCDVTLAVDGRTVKCHQMVLAASSPYFQGIFMENTCKHPIVFLKDMKYNHIRSLVEYIYYGEAAVPEDELQGLLKIAESLKIKGLVEIEEDKPKEKEPKKLGVRKDLSAAGYRYIFRSPPNIVINNHNLLENGLKPNPLGLTPSKDDDANELIIDEDDSMHSSDASINGHSNGGPVASGNGQAVTPIEVSPEYPGYNSDDTPPAPGMIRVVGANGKAEWKRYKQYTKDDILAAIEEVKAGMSALQASRKYGVPSRTLYDKVKKMGILTANMQKQIQQKKGAPTPPVSTNSNSNGGTNSSANNSPAPQINFLGLQVPQANLPTVVNGHDANNSATISGISTPAIPSSLMMSVMSMMSEKLKAGGLINKNVLPENLSSLLKKSSAGSEGSDSGHSSEEVENGDIVVIKDEKGNTDGLSHDDIAEDPADKPAPTAAASTAQQILNHLVSLNSLAALNNSTSTTGAANVTLMPRNIAAAADKPGPNSPVSATRMSSVITSTGSALKRKRSSSASESSLESQKDVTEVKKLLVEPQRQEAA